MVWEGLLNDAIAICYGIQKRYDPAKHNPYNEVECGDHYARAMASWGVYTALSGYEYHGPKGHLGFAPKITPEKFTAAFTAAEGWGTLTQKRDDKVQRERIAVNWGRLRVETLAFEIPDDFDVDRVTASLDHVVIRSSYTLKGRRVEIKLVRPQVAEQGHTLEVAIHRKGK
jgi:non-lysosomal glucosylceramidase